MTRKQIKYFGTKRQRAALKAGRKRAKKKTIGATPKRKSGKRKSAKRKATKRRRSVAVIVAGPKRKKRRASGIAGPMKNIVKSLIPAGAAFGGGYVSSMIDDALVNTVEDTTMRSVAVGAAGMLLVMMNPSGAIGAAGLGVIGGAGRGMAGGGSSDAAPDAAGTRGVGRRRGGRVSRFRAAMRHRMNGGADSRRVVTGMPDDRSVVTGPGRSGASYSTVRNRW